MGMSLLHAFAVILTVLLFVVRQRFALPSISSGKRRNVQQQVTQQESAAKPAVPAHIVQCAQDYFLIDPKHKRDPEIDIDNEEIGFYPMG